MLLGLNPPTTLGAACGLLLLCLLYVARMVYKGHLIPRYHVDKLEEDRNYWRASSEALIPIIKEIGDQQRELLTGMRIVQGVMGTVQQKAGEMEK